MTENGQSNYLLYVFEFFLRASLKTQYSNPNHFFIFFKYFVFINS